MGKYFLMSNRFDKKSAEDFGLNETENGFAIDPKDNSVWKVAYLYDFGWGAENGYCKDVELSFVELIELVLNGDREDSYGAASIILKKFSDELLTFCENMFSEKSDLDVKKMVEIFNLTNAFNRCSITNKTIDLITIDYNRWKDVAEKAKQYVSKNKKTNLWGRLFHINTK